MASIPPKAKTGRALRGAALALAGLAAGVSVAAQESRPPACDSCQSMEDAWWTGPMLANSAATLPRGHFLFEPYLYDVRVHGRYDAEGSRQSTPRSNGFGSLTYILYGLTDHTGIGVIPSGGYTTARGSSSGVGMGDLTIQLQQRLTQFQPGRALPTISVTLQETVPTAKYDRLGDRPNDGFGGGAWVTTLAVYSQSYFWLPNDRILRMRLNASRSFSGGVTLRDVSVYGTESGFQGDAKPGESWFLNASWEYSVTRSWALALDATYQHNGSTRVEGYVTAPGSGPSRPIHFESGTSHAFGLAPAIEYSWSPNVGVLLGVRVIPAGRNTAFTVTPAIAINIVR